MKDCILAVFWPREEIYTFFIDNACTKQDLTIIDNYKEIQFNRSTMVDRMFKHLSSKPDGGLAQFRSMLHSLVNWSRFDPYYFDKLRKLDKEKAQKCLYHLRQLQEIRDAKIKEEKKRRDEAELAKGQPKIQLSDLLNTFLELCGGKITHQKRGYVLEKILNDLAKLNELAATEPFRICGEQIDGAIKYDGEYYILEAKWQDRAASNEPVYQFVSKVDGKMHGRGIFVSINGFTEYVVSSIVSGKVIKTIFVDGEDLVLVLEGHLSLKQMLDCKIKAAQTKGLIYVHPLSGLPK